MNSSKHLSLIGILVAMTTSWASSSVGETHGGQIPVSLVQLISNPRATYGGDRIQVYGYLAHGVNLRLFLTQDHARIGDIASSVVVTDATADASLVQGTCPNNYVRLVGRLGRFDQIHLAVVDVEEVEIVQPRIVCWKAEG